MKFLLVLGLFISLQLALGEDLMTSALVEKKTVTKGSFNGLEIGLSKAETLHRIVKLGATAVKPIPTISFTVNYRNQRNLDKVSRAEGIRLTDYGGYAIDLYLTDGRVSSIRRSVPAEKDSWGKEGMPLTELVTGLEQRLAENHRLVVFPIVRYEGDGWIKIVENDGAQKVLLQYDAWTFGVSKESPGGAIYEVYFKSDSLTRIEYRRERVRLD